MSEHGDTEIKSMVKEFVTHGGEKIPFPGGATRSNNKGKGRFDLISPWALTRLAMVMERGAEIHGDRNWEKGFPVNRAIDSAIRHLVQYQMGMTDEDHLGQAAFNVFAAIHMDEGIDHGVYPLELAYS